MTSNHVVRVTEFDASGTGLSEIRYFFFSVNDYRSIMSLAAFQRSTYTQTKRAVWYDVCSGPSSVLRDPNGRLYYDPNVPHVEVDSIWEFYKLIGWDYKKKRFTTK